jgi:predicted HicB family RNase H-like nuclease
MTNVMNYKGYRARVEYDGDDECFIGHLAGINDVVGFHATSVKDLKKAFREAVDDYIDTCAKVGRPPEKPFSGKVMFRIAPEVHADAALAAQLAGKSLNQWAEEVLRQAANAGTQMGQDD